MAAGAAKWIWENSRASNGSLIVLLAIADECGEGEFTEMKIADLARKCRLSDKGARRALKDLAALGELTVEARSGGVSRYALSPEFSTTPVKMTGPPLPDPGQNDRTTPVKMTGPRSTTPVKMTGVDKPGQTNSRSRKHPESEQLTPVKMTGPVDNFPDTLLTVTGSSLVPVKDVPAKSPPRRRDRPDVDALCEHLASRIEANGCKRPETGKRWRDAARLLLDKDGRTEEQVHACIDWCQDDEFWRGNILSMPKLREKYDQLRMHAMRGRKSARQPTESEYDEQRRIARALDEQEAAR